MKTLSKKKMCGNILITDPMYIARQDKLEDLATKPDKTKFYPDNWSPPTEEDYFNNTEKALVAKRCEQNYKEALSEWYDSLPNDWDVCNYGENMEHLGINHYIVNDTIYGNWSCTTFDMQDNVLGRFTSDSGLVGVFLLEEVLKYNPTWDLHLTKPYCATLLPNFDGIIGIVNRGGSFAGDSDVRVVGKGTLNFYTKQTGF